MKLPRPSKSRVITFLLEVALLFYVLRFIDGWPKLVAYLLAIAVSIRNHADGWETGFKRGLTMGGDAVFEALKEKLHEEGLELEEVKHDKSA